MGTPSLNQTVIFSVWCVCFSVQHISQQLRLWDVLKYIFLALKSLPKGGKKKHFEIPSAIVWRVTNTKKIYRDVSGKPCVSVCRQVTEGRGDVGTAEGKHAYLSFTPCESIWTTSRTYVSNGCGLHGSKRGGDVSSYDISYLWISTDTAKCNMSYCYS